jgi:DNA-binding NarL/FixJ family response regulator
MSPDVPIRVVLVDDHEMVAKSLGWILEQESDIEVLGSASTSAEGVALVIATMPDVAIVDYRLPDEDGTRTTKEICDASPGTKVLILTGTKMDSQMVSTAVRAGCAGILSKDKALHQLVKAVRAAHSGGAYVSSDAVPKMLARIRLDHSRLGGDLSKREIDVLQLAADGMSNQEIASRLFVSVNTVRNHTQRILLKLGVHSKLEAVAVAHREGLIE